MNVVVPSRLPGQSNHCTHCELFIPDQYIQQIILKQDVVMLSSRFTNSLDICHIWISLLSLICTFVHCYCQMTASLGNITFTFSNHGLNKLRCTLFNTHRCLELYTYGIVIVFRKSCFTGIVIYL